MLEVLKTLISDYSSEYCGYYAWDAEDECDQSDFSRKDIALIGVSI